MNTFACTTVLTTLNNFLPKGKITNLTDGIPGQEDRSRGGSDISCHPLSKFKKCSTPVAEDRLDEVSVLCRCFVKYYPRFCVETF